MASTSITAKKTTKGKKEIDMSISKEDAKDLKKGREEREYQKRIIRQDSLLQQARLQLRALKHVLQLLQVGT